MAIVLSSCDSTIHFYPEEPEPPKPKTLLILNLKHEQSLPLYKNIIIQAPGARSRQEPLWDVRHIVKLYPLSDANSKRSSSRGEPLTYIFTHDYDPLSHDSHLELEVPAGEYDVRVWTDYVLDGHVNDFRYLTSDFASITVSEPHYGCSDSGEAYKGEVTATVIEYQTTEKDVDMTRPMARFRFIATDIREFAEQLNQAGNSRGDNPDNAPGRSVNPDDYHIVFRYSGYMPCTYNMFIDHPTNSRVGVKFSGQMVSLSDEEMELGHDYCFTNGKETSVDVAVDVYDREGTLLASSPSVNVPLLRGHLTEIRGRFLTTRTTGGVSISPGYNGNINIEIK